MAFEIPKQLYSGNIKPVTLGVGDKAVTVGGEPSPAHIVKGGPSAACDGINHAPILRSSAGIIHNGTGTFVGMIVAIKDDIHAITFKNGYQVSSHLT